jgi:hypothetical protein
MSVQFFDIGGAEVAICSGPPMREHSRKSMGVRWCFKCRGRHEFAWIVMASDIVYDANGDIDPVMYMAEPFAHSESSCGTPPRRSSNSPMPGPCAQDHRRTHAGGGRMTATDPAVAAAERALIDDSIDSDYEVGRRRRR